MGRRLMRKDRSPGVALHNMLVFRQGLLGYSTFVFLTSMRSITAHCYTSLAAFVSHVTVLMEPSCDRYYTPKLFRVNSLQAHCN